MLPATVHLSQLFIHPVKSCRGIGVDVAEVDDRGLRYDRRWMVSDPGGGFLTQRDHPRLATVVPTIRGQGLELEAPGMPTLVVPAEPTGTPTLRVGIWRDEVAAVSAGDEAAAWFSKVLGLACELVGMPASTRRGVSPRHGRPGDLVSFADGYPLLLISQSSLDELNRRLEAPVPMERFRPNLVVDGCGPHDEDLWRTLNVGGITFHNVKPCARCVITTTDHVTGERGPEPLRTLARYRTVDGRILFGVNLVHDRRGTLRVGDAVQVCTGL
jgi:uncharacterized protein YcbX